MNLVTTVRLEIPSVIWLERWGNLVWCRW